MLVFKNIGSYVAFYFWPSALIREFIAIHAEKALSDIRCRMASLLARADKERIMVPD